MQEFFIAAAMFLKPRHNQKHGVFPHTQWAFIGEKPVLILGKMTQAKLADWC